MKTRKGQLDHKFNIKLHKRIISTLKASANVSFEDIHKKKLMKDKKGLVNIPSSLQSKILSDGETIQSFLDNCLVEDFDLDLNSFHNSMKKNENSHVTCSSLIKDKLKNEEGISVQGYFDKCVVEDFNVNLSSWSSIDLKIRKIKNPIVLSDHLLKDYRTALRVPSVVKNRIKSELGLTIQGYLDLKLSEKYHIEIAGWQRPDLYKIKNIA